MLSIWVSIQEPFRTLTIVHHQLVADTEARTKLVFPLRNLGAAFNSGHTSLDICVCCTLSPKGFKVKIIIALLQWVSEFFQFLKN
jgi:hypothetical protein